MIDFCVGDIDPLLFDYLLELFIAEKSISVCISSSHGFFKGQETLSSLCCQSLFDSQYYWFDISELTWVNILVFEMRVTRDWSFLIFISPFFWKIFIFVMIIMRSKDRTIVFIFPEISRWLLNILASTDLWFILEISWSVRSLRTHRLLIFFKERRDNMRPEWVIRVVIKGDESKAIMKIILSKDSIIYSLKFHIKINRPLEVFFVRFTQISTDHVMDRKFSFPSIIQWIEGSLNILQPFFIYLSL